ncbi:C4-dicarboxylate TRAP transporter substrate-binding protein DctB [Bacillaceae bacterium]
MRTLAGIALIIAFGLLTALAVGFGFRPLMEPPVYDDEQQGLDEQLVIKFSHVVAENTPKGLAAQRFADLVRKRSNGRIRVEVFPNGTLYSDVDELDALMRGDVQMIAPAFSKLTSLFPPWLVLDLPFAFANEEAVKAAFTGKIGQTLLGMLEEKNMKGLAFWGNGFKQMTSNRRPIRLPGDLQGQKFRIMPSEVIAAQFQTLGVETYPISFNDVYRNLENGFLDGEENTISNIYSKRFYQVQKYLTISNHGYLGYCVIMNRDFWNGLPREAQEIIREAMAETTEWLRTEAIRMNQEQLAKIKGNPSVRIHELTAEEKSVWIRKLQPVYDRFAPVIGEELMREVEKLQEKYPVRPR